MIFVSVGAALGALAVVLGAIGAHLLSNQLSPAEINMFALANRFQFYHALALVALGTLKTQAKHFLISWAGWLMTLGCVLFSGSLYVFAITAMPFWERITPLGGTLLIIAWIILAIAASVLLKRHQSCPIR